MKELSSAAQWPIVALVAMAGCVGTLAPSPGAPDAGEVGRGSVDAAADAFDFDGGSSSDGAFAGALDADATLPFEGSAPDAGAAVDAQVGDRDADASAETLPTDGSMPDGGSPPDGTPGDTEDASADADGLPSTAPCLTGGHVLSVEGDPGSIFFTGVQTDALGSSWAVEAEEYYALFDGALIEVTPPPSADAGGAGWFLNFNTWNTMTRMQTGIVYDVATVANSDSFGYTRTCASAGGSFRVDEFDAPDASIGGVSMLIGFTAAFAITCDGYPGVLRGCVHFRGQWAIPCVDVRRCAADGLWRGRDWNLDA